MYFSLVCRDKPDHLQTRLDHRAAHLDYARASGSVFLAGPMIQNETMVGSLVILDVADRASAEAWAAADPYAKAGLFQSVDISEWKRVIG
jgi:uncharacterized protein YciI